MNLRRLAFFSLPLALLLGVGSGLSAQAPVAMVRKETWSKDLPDSTPPILLNDKSVYVCDGTQLGCFDLNTGAKIWEVASPVGKAWPANILGDQLILVSDAFEVASVEAATGKLTWKMSLDGLAKGGVGFGSVVVVSSPVTRPVLAEGLILFGTHGLKFLKGRTGKCYAVEAATGKLAWVFETEDGVEHQPIIEGDRVFLGGISATYALDLKKGTQIWKTETRSDNQFTFVLRDGLLLVSSGHYGSRGAMFSGTTYGLDAKSGQPRWKFDMGGPSAMGVGEGKAVGIEWGSMGGTRLTCLDLGTGMKAWELKEKSSAWPLVGGGRVIYETRDNQVQVLDLQTGKPVGTFKVPGDFEMGWVSPWSRFLDPFMLGEKAAVASWDKSNKQTVIQTIDVVKGSPSEEIRVDGRLLDRPLLAGGRMICATEKASHLVTVKVY